MNCTIEYIMAWLKEHLTNERYEHSIGTAECAEELAQKFLLDKDKAYLAGLVHDCAKYLPLDEVQKIIKHLSLEEGELCNKKTVHAPAGMILAQKEFGIEDKEILSAIRWHTLGKSDMSDFEKLIFLADKIESRTRPAEYREPVANALQKGLDDALLVCYKQTINSLTERNLKICPTTIEIYNSLISRINNVLD